MYRSIASELLASGVAGALRLALLVYHLLEAGTPQEDGTWIQAPETFGTTTMGILRDGSHVSVSCTAISVVAGACYGYDYCDFYSPVTASSGCRAYRAWSFPAQGLGGKEEEFVQ